MGEGRPDQELDFYQGYGWCLSPYPTVRQTIAYLGGELDKLATVRESWQVTEVMTNVYLLSCALLNSIDEYLRGTTFKLPAKAPVVPFSRSLLRAMEAVAAIPGVLRRRSVRRWRARWQASFDAFIALFIAPGPPGDGALAGVGRAMAALLRPPLPAKLLAEHIYFPSAFRKHDLTHLDMLELGRRFLSVFPDRKQPILLTGLRTAGSYFNPLLRALLHSEGCASVDSVTIRPDRGMGGWERTVVRRCCRAGAMAVVLDDAPGTGNTLALAVDLLRKAGLPNDRIVILVPVHPASRDWRTHVPSLADIVALSTSAEEWHKQRLLQPKMTEGRLTEYFQAQHFTSASVIESSNAENLNAHLQEASEDARRTRLKRIYEVRLTTRDGHKETRYVLAKSVGWGWLGYHAFLAGHRLSGFVPEVLGLRDGILYSEWLPQREGANVNADRDQWLRTTASYVAARARSLRLSTSPGPGLGLHQHHDGFGLLDKVLSKAYGGALLSGLMRPRVRHRLACQAAACPLPTLIDGKMQPAEWIVGPGGLLKTDYEHHGMGKNELNVLDPAYDLAEAILHLALSPEEESELLRRYSDESGDIDPGKRLFLHKLLAGTWAMASALKGLFCHQGNRQRQQELHRQFIAAWHFLTIHTARQCGSYCRPATPPCWRSPLVVLDIDGVLDRRVFGFPCTTAAGIESLALLHAHGLSVAVDTARSAEEVREYCRAYGLAGGVAEHGSYIWDAVANRGRVLVSPESLRQLERVRRSLEQVPGAFLDDRHTYSIRATTYADKSPSRHRRQVPPGLRSIRTYTTEDQGPVPLAAATVQELLAAPGLERLDFHQTGSDTTILAREVDKGSGLLGLLEWVGLADAETVAIGDSEPDLAMFGVARRSFAPAQIKCLDLARAAGCRISREPFQRGLLAIVRSLVRCGPARRPRPCSLAGRDLFLDLLQAADQNRFAVLLRSLLDPKTYRVFLR